MSINGKAVVSTSSIDPLTVVETSVFNDYKKTLVHFNETNAVNAKLLLLNKNSETNEFFITQTNDIKVDDDNGYVIAKAFIMQSDRNLKTDIREDCFAKEMPSLHGFKWKDTSVQSYGFIAQELEEEGFGHLVTEHDGIKGVDYMAALSYKVAQLEQENEMLWNAIHDLQQKLNNK